MSKTHGTKTLISLMEDHELSSLHVPNLVSEGAKRGIKVERFPIPDMSTPSNLAAARALVAKIVALLDAGVHVTIHCRGGNGRSGLIAACVLVELGKTPAQAIQSVRSVRPPAVETAGQEAFVAHFGG